MTRTTKQLTKGLGKRSLVAAAVSAAIVGAVAVSEPWSPVIAAPEAGTANDHDARRVCRSGQRGAPGGRQRSGHPRHPAGCAISHEVAGARHESPGFLPALPFDAGIRASRRAQGRGRRVRIHRRRIGTHRHQQPRGEGERIRSPSRCRTDASSKRGWPAPTRRPTWPSSRSTPARRCRWSSSVIRTGRGSATGVVAVG